MFCVVKLYHLSPVLLRCNPKEFILGEKYQTYFLKYLKYNHWVFCTICIIIVETDFQKKSLFNLSHLQYFHTMFLKETLIIFLMSHLFPKYLLLIVLPIVFFKLHKGQP